ncbi:MAG: LLM class flavin-dependent oxidoreductase [Chloroflexota bacterium]
MAISFGYCAPIFAGAGDAHPRTPLLERVDLEHLRRSIEEAELNGYDSLWVADHLMLGRESFIFEGWTFLSWASQVTDHMRLVPIHLSNVLRDPALTAKTAATLDVISGGRLDLFFEAGQEGAAPEASAYGFEFPDYPARLERFEEAVRIVKAMWTEDRPSFDGAHYAIEEAICYPKPVQKPHPPVWIGTLGGEPLTASEAVPADTASLIARHADAWNNTPAPVEHCRHVIATLDEACSAIGREPRTLRKTLETQVLIADTPGQARRLQDHIQRMNPIGHTDWDRLSDQYVIGDPETVTRRIRDYADLGIEGFGLWFMDYPSLDGMRTFARRVMPYFKEA